MAAGDNTDNAVIWNLGDATGKKNSGASAAIPLNAVQTGAGAPSGQPTTDVPFYVNTQNNKLYAYNGTVWVAISGFNT